MRKKLLFIITLLVSIHAFAQSSDSAYRNSSGIYPGHDLPVVKPHLKFLSIIDSKRHYGYSIKKVNPNNILEVKVLKVNDAAKKYGELGLHGAVEITTIKHAIVIYQNKLGGFSNEYKKYLSQNKNDDSNLLYFVNCVEIKDSKYEIIKTLYEAVDLVKTVDFIDKFSKKLSTNNSRPIVIITTKI